MTKLQTVLLAVIAVALVGLLALQIVRDDPGVVTVEPCIVVVNPTQHISADGYPVADPYRPPGDDC